MGVHGVVSDADEHVDARERRPGRHHREAEARACADAGRNAQLDVVKRPHVAAAAAEAAPFLPGLAAAAAAEAGLAHRDADGNGRALERLERREDDLGGELLERIRAKERMAHAVQHIGHRGKIDRDFVGEPVAAPGRGIGERGPLGIVRPPSPRIAENLVGAGSLEEGDRTVVSRDVGMIAGGPIAGRRA